MCYLFLDQSIMTTTQSLMEHPKQDLNNLRPKHLYSYRGGGLEDSLLAFYSDDLSSNPVDK